MPRKILLWILISIIVAMFSACSGMRNMQFSNKDNWEIIFDGDSNLNEFTQYGSANWRIQDGNIQADLLLSKTPSYLITKCGGDNIL